MKENRMLGNIGDIVSDKKVDLHRCSSPENPIYIFTPRDFLDLYFCRIETGEGVTYVPDTSTYGKKPLEVIEQHVFGGY